MAGLAELGGFHALQAPPAPGSDAVGWAEVLAGDALTRRFATVRGALAAGSGITVEELDPKVAVSATQVGLASRLWSVALAAGVLHGWVPALTSAQLVASPVHRGAVPLGLLDPDAGYAVASPAQIAAVVADVVVDDSLRALDAACSRLGHTPARVLTSNAASSLVGAARVLARLRPAAGPAAWAVVRDLLQHPALAVGGQPRDPRTLPAGVGGPMERRDETFMRHGCCVFYRLPGHGLCPDCVLAERQPDQVTPGHH